MSLGEKLRQIFGGLIIFGLIFALVMFVVADKAIGNITALFENDPTTGVIVIGLIVVFFKLLKK